MESYPNGMWLTEGVATVANKRINLHDREGRYNASRLYGDEMFIVDKIRELEFCIEYIETDLRLKNKGALTKRMQDEIDLYISILNMYDELFRPDRK